MRLTKIQPANRLMLCLTTFVCATSGRAADNDPRSAVWNMSDGSAVRIVSRTAASDTEHTYMRYHLSADRNFQKISLTTDQQPTLPLTEFRATVAVNCSQRGVRAALRMILPRQTDPRTNKPLVTYLKGDAYKTIESWETLHVEGSPQAVEAQIRALRTELNLSGIDAADCYFDGIVLDAEIHQGDTFLDIGEVTWQPVVPPQKTVNSGTHHASESLVRVQREQLIRNKRPFVITLIPDHGESVDSIGQLGCNAVWIPDAGASERMRSLLEKSLLVVATPPHPEFDPTDFTAPVQGLPPLEYSHPLPSIWYMGTRVDASQLPHLLSWAREVRSADRKLRRPLMADVRSDTDVASRQIDILGQSQHELGGRQSFGRVRNTAFVRQSASAELAVPWEWIQTEASENVKQWRQRTGSVPIHPEPEQILMQTAACLSAGSRGIGIWKTRSLSDGSEQTEELRCAIELAGIYVRILEPFVADGHVEGHLSIQTDPQPVRQTSWQLNAAREPQLDYSIAPTGPDGAIIGSGGTSVVLACHWDLNSQFVPQELFSEKAAFTVAATETASAWRVTATQVRGLRRQRTAGGLYVNISNFDQLAIVLVSSDPAARQQIERRVHQNAKRAAELFARLAFLKLRRVRTLCEAIDHSTGSPNDAVAQFSLATRLTDEATAALNREDYAATETAALYAMRVVRGIQNQYWYRAVQSLPSPAASPHTVNFTTLPDHWRMMQRVQTTQPGENLLPSGDFNDVTLFSQSEWQSVSSQPDQFHISAAIVDDDRRNGAALRMRAWAKSREIPTTNHHPTLMLQSPEITARKGDLFEIRGRVRMGSNIVASTPTPLLIFDTDLGPELAVNPQLEPSWRTFQFFRVASTDGPFRLWLALQGAAEVYVDDLTVVRRRDHRIFDEQPVARPLVTPETRLGNPRSRVQGAGYSIP